MRRPLFSSSTLVLFAGLAVTGGCGGEQPHPGGPLPDSVFAEAPWEQALPDTYADYREGTVFEAVTDQGEIRRAFPGVKVELLVPRPDGREPFTAIAETVSDAEGRFRIGPGPAAVWALRASAPGYAPMIGGVRLNAAGPAGLAPSGPVRLWLRKARPLRGRVEDAAGAPVAGVKVRGTAMAFSAEVRTGVDGSFELRPPIGQATVWVDDPERERDRTLVDVGEDGAAAPVVLRGAEIQELRGVVVSAFDGRPVSGAVVWHPGQPQRRTASDAQGRFALRAPRHRHMVAAADGWGWRTQMVPRAGDMEFRMYPVARLTGRVVDHGGSPVEGARIVGVAQRHDRGFDGILGPLTDAEGRFEMGWMPPAPRGRKAVPKILALRHGLGMSEAVEVVPGPDLEPVHLVLTGTFTAAGRVTRSTGAPVAGAFVQGLFGYGGLSDAEAHGLQLLRDYSTVTDAEGRYRLAEVPRAGGALVELSVSGLSDKRELPASAAEHGVHTIDFELPEGRAIAGTVVDHGGAPVTEGTVELRLLDGGRVELTRRVPIGKDGSFRGEDLAEGRYQLSVAAPGFDRGGATAKAGDSDVRITAIILAHVRFTVGFPEDATAPERRTPVHITLRRVGGSGAGDRTATVTPEEEGSIPIIEAGVYDVFATAGVWRGELFGFEIQDGDRRTLEVPLRRTLIVPMRLLDAAGRPVADQAVNWRPIRIAGARTQRARTGPDGRLDLTGLAPGTWEIAITPDGGAPLRRTLEVAGSRTDVLELRMPAHGTLLVRVKDGDGAPVERAIVTLRAAAGETLYAFPAEGLQRLASRFATDAKGEIRLVGVRAGEVRVKVGKAEKPIQVTAGGKAVAEFP